LVKNNLKSLLIHLTISIASIFIFFLFNMGQPKWASEQAYIKYHNSMMGIAFAVIVVATILYYSLGKKYLINQGSIYKNLFSVTLTIILSLFLWGYALNIDRIGISDHLLNSHLWERYSMYNGYSFFLIKESDNNNPYVFLLSSFIPTIAMWVGLQRKRN